MEISKSDDELAAEAERKRAQLEHWNSLTPQEQAEAIKRADDALPPLGAGDQA